MYYCCGITDKGSVRDHNEDAFLIGKTVVTDDKAEFNMEPPFIAAVADGVGGEACGEVASRYVLEMARDIRISCGADYVKPVLDIHRGLRRYGMMRSNPNMQTTFCGLVIDDEGSAAIINVGDSKLFRYRGGIIRQLSRDQSLVQILYEQGEITAEEKKKHIHRNVILPVMGNAEEDPDIAVTPIAGGIIPGDLILICSDGLSDYITTGDFEDTLARPIKLPKRLAMLKELAVKGGSADNITVVGVSIM